MMKITSCHLLGRTKGRIIGFEARSNAGTAVASEEAETGQSISNPLCGDPEATADREEDDHEYFDFDRPENQRWFTHIDAPQPRPRPTYSKMCMTMKREAIIHMVMNVHKEFDDSNYTECAKILNTSTPRHEDHRMLAQILAAHSQNDMDWDKALASDDRNKVIEALEKEMESLTSTILTEVKEDDEEYNQACELATPDRILLGIKRSGIYKSRGVKQGFKEDIEQADGPNFNYYAHVAKFNSIRMTTFRSNRGTRRIALSRIIGFEARSNAGTAVASEEAETGQSISNPLCGDPEATADREEDDHEYFDFDRPENQRWFTHIDAPQPRPRPTYSKMCMTMKREAIIHMVMNVHKEFDDSNYTECAKILNTSTPRHEDHRMLAQILAAHSQNDMDWDKALASDDRNKVIEALEKEMESLTSTILTEVKEDDEEYNQACELATPDRILLGIKRSGIYKSRGVKQGFKEDIEQADGPNFNYYAHVAKFNSIRMTTFRSNRGTRRIALKDVSTAFLQSNKYPEGTNKYVSFKDPLTKKWRYYRQSGPLYGEKSATKRWEDTIAPWYEEIGYIRGENEPCAFHHEDSDSLVLLYTDDNFIDADEEDINWTSDQLDKRFMCKDAEWLSTGEELDCLGMQLFQTQGHTGFYLQTYIEKTLKILGLDKSNQTCRTPICKDIDDDSMPLTGDRLRLYATAIGSFGWMANTCRPDIAYAHSRMSQHLTNPTESAWEAVIRCCNYLRGTSDLCIAAPIHSQDRDIDTFNQNGSDHGWEFYCDSDFAGNAEEQNNRRSQNGFIALLNGAPIMWGSKVSSVAFAHPDIGEAHPDISSGAAEVYAASNATFEFLHLSYTADEMGIPFPKPIMMQVDNKAAKAFADNTAFKTKLKHIDVRQKWVKTLTDKKILCTKHVPSQDNLVDIFTKRLDADAFERLRDRMMKKKSDL